MRKKNLLVILMLFVLCPCFAEKTRSILSFDTGYLARSLKNNGWGIGISYEQEIYKGFAIKAGFSHTSMWLKNPKIIVTTVGISADALYYPFRLGLDWLYFGGKCYTDFLMYNGSSISEENKDDTVISLMPQIGCKLSFEDIMMIDGFVGYSFIINSRNHTELIKDKVKNSFEYGIKFRINLRNLINQFFS